MARLNEILVGRFSKFFQKHYGIKGPVPVGTLAPEIMPVHAVFSGVENRFLEGWNRYAFFENITGAAGVNAGVRLRNPVASGSIGVIESILIGSATAQQISEAYDVGAQGIVDLGSGFSGSTLDPRNSASSALKGSFQTNASPIATGIGLFFIAASSAIQLIQFEEQEFVLPPGASMTWITNTVATALVISLIWRERPLEESEVR